MTAPDPRVEVKLNSLLDYMTADDLRRFSAALSELTAQEVVPLDEVKALLRGWDRDLRWRDTDRHKAAVARAWELVDSGAIFAGLAPDQAAMLAADLGVPPPDQGASESGQ